MKIETDYRKEMTIEEFADKHNLTMVITERRLIDKNDSDRYYARFKNSEVKRGKILVGEHGNGSTPEKAIAHYILSIMFKTLVINAMSKDRVEIEVPRLSYHIK